MSDIVQAACNLKRSLLKPPPREPSQQGYRFPFPPFPTGWYHLCFSDELPRGGVKAVVCCGRELVAFRGQDNAVRVLDAYCPHVGAHLGHGGVVRDNNIQCPFHGWVMNGQGQCVRVPYATKIPPKARTRSWPVIERNGLIHIYFDVEGKEPEWSLPHLAQDGDDWVKPFGWKRWTVRTHPQEIMENSVDVTHFGHLHGGPLKEVLSESLSFDGPRLYHSARQVLRNDRRERRGEPLRTAPLHATLHGLGFLEVQFALDIRVHLDLMTALSIRPIDEEHIDLIMFITIKKLKNRLATRALAAFALRNGVKTLEQDLPILERKRFAETPTLCEGDGPIMRYRRWARQFYGSPAASHAGAELSASPA